MSLLNRDKEFINSYNWSKMCACKAYKILARYFPYNTVDSTEFLAEMLINNPDESIKEEILEKWLYSVGAY